MKWLFVLLLLFAGCTAYFGVSTDDISYSVGVTGYNIPLASTEFAFYGEGCVCLEELPEGVEIDSAFVTGRIVNNTSSSMDFDVRISATGNTDCGEDTIYYEYKTPFDEFSNKPSYIDSADILFSGTIPPGDSVTFDRFSPALTEGIKNGQIWIIVKNVSSVGITGTFNNPFQRGPESLFFTEG